MSQHKSEKKHSKVTHGKMNTWVIQERWSGLADAASEDDEDTRL